MTKLILVSETATPATPLFRTKAQYREAIITPAPGTTPRIEKRNGQNFKGEVHEITNAAGRSVKVLYNESGELHTYYDRDRYDDRNLNRPMMGAAYEIPDGHRLKDSGNFLLCNRQ